MKNSSQQQVGFEDQKLSEKRWKCLRRLLPLCVLLAAILVVFLGLLIYTVQNCNRGVDSCELQECEVLAERFLSSRDPDFHPCQDFFGYICGNWSAKHSVSEGKGSANTFTNLWEENQRIVRELLERSQRENSGSAEEKARKFYQSCMNTEKIQELGAEPMIELINQVTWRLDPHGTWNQSNFNKTLHVLMGEYKTFPFFKAYMDFSPWNSTTRIIQIDYPDFDMPSKSQYADYAEGLRVYLSYLNKLGELLVGTENVASLQIPLVFSFMSQLLNEVTPTAEHREKRMFFQRTTIQDLQELAPSIDWLSSLRAIFQSLVLNASESILVHDMEYLKGISRVLEQYQKTSLLHMYMILCLVQNLTPALDDRFQRARMELNKGLRGNSTQTMVLTPHWKKCVTDTSSFYEPVVGAMFVRETFQPKTKKLAEDMFSKVQAVLRSQLGSLEWMDKQTRKEAMDKFQPHEDTFFANVLEFLRLSQKRIHLEPVDTHGEEYWEVPPFSVYSYYSLKHNTVIFPAGMFRSPFFHKDFPSAVNFGAAGMFMAHELLHALYEYVNLGPGSKQREALDRGTRCLVEQYEKYSFHGLAVNGTVTLLENFADNGGLDVAHQAYESWAQKRTRKKILPKIGLRPHQLFFASFAQAFCGTETSEGLRETLLQDRHSPPRFRVLGAIANSKDFGGLFQCAKGSPMNPESKCRIW